MKLLIFVRKFESHLKMFIRNPIFIYQFHIKSTYNCIVDFKTSDTSKFLSISYFKIQRQNTLWVLTALKKTHYKIHFPERSLALWHFLSDILIIIILNWIFLSISCWFSSSIINLWIDSCTFNAKLPIKYQRQQ